MTKYQQQLQRKARLAHFLQFAETVPTEPVERVLLRLDSADCAAIHEAAALITRLQAGGRSGGSKPSAARAEAARVNGLRGYKPKPPKV